MLDRRVVILMGEAEHERLRAYAARQRKPVAEVVREAIRQHMAAVRDSGPTAEDAVSFICQEHDSDFDWHEVEKQLARRYGE